MTEKLAELFSESAAPAPPSQRLSPSQRAAARR